MSEDMNLRERYLATMRFEACPRTPRWEMGYWSGAIRRWYEEGMPGTQQEDRKQEALSAWVRGPGQAGDLYETHKRDMDVMRYFDMDECTARIGLNDAEPVPKYEKIIVEETDEYTITREADGVTQKQLKTVGGMPEWLDYPIHSRKEWEKFKGERFQPELAERLPENWKERLEVFRKRNFPIAIGGTSVGFFGATRKYLGVERALTLFYDDPTWLHEMMDYFADFYVTLYDQILTEIKVDYAALWEDMCYVGGPLISPRAFEAFMSKPYKKVTSCLRDHGIDIILVDTDGDARQLIPLFIEAGVSVLYPFEAVAHMNVSKIRKQYPRLGMAGGIDKQALARGKDAIDRELEEKVPVVLEGGYIPHVDHGVPMDISWENFRYYRQKLDSMLDEYDAQRWEKSG